jgi:acyl carrier protein
MDTRDKIIKIIKEQLNVKESEIKLEASFVDDLGADSLDTVELLMAIEEEFGIEVPDEDADKAKTVGDVINYINSALGDHAAQ